MSAVRDTILENLPAGYEEGIQYGMISYFVPHAVYPNDYHCDPKQPLPFVSLASQKNHMAAYLFCLYLDPAEIERFQTDWLATGKKLDMGKSCVRFKDLDGVALGVLGECIARASVDKFIKLYDAQREAHSRGRPTKKTARAAETKPVTKKPVTKTAATKKAVTKKTAKTATSKKTVSKKTVSKKTVSKKTGSTKTAGGKVVKKAGR